MSGVISSVGKIFKPVLKGAKKALPYVAAAAAVYFTASAAFPELGLGTVGGTIGSAIEGVAGTGALADVLTSSLTHAAYGAALGTAASAISGGDIEMGALYGAGGGALTGAVSGLLNTTGLFGGGGASPSQPSASEQYAPSQAASAVASSINPAADPDSFMDFGRVDTPVADFTSGQGAGEGIADYGQYKVGGGVTETGNWWNGPTQAASTTEPSSLNVPPTPPAAVATPGTFEKGGWLERNQTLAGNAALGLGQGLIKWAASSEAGGDPTAGVYAKQDVAQQNYASTGRGLLTGTPPRQPGGSMAPTQRFSGQYYAGGRYVYDPDSGQIIWMPNQV